MPLKDHMFFRPEEIKDLSLVIATLSFLFSLTYIRFSTSTKSFIVVFSMFLIFFFFLLFGRLLLMKIDAFRHGFEIFFRQIHFNRFGLRVYDTLSHYVKSSSFKGVPMILVSFFIYVFSFGLLIFPSLWNYNIKRIPYKHLGSKERFEHKLSFHYQHITYFRYTKVLFLGYIYYLLFALLLKLLLGGTEIYYWFLFSIFWIAFFTLIPIPGTEGFELFGKNTFAWITTLPVLVLGLLSLLVFTNPFTIFFAIFVSLLLIFLVVFWRHLMK